MTFGSDSISNLQRFLNGKLQPSPNLAVDGVMGPRTREALQRYEEVRARVGIDAALIDAHLQRGHVWTGIPEGWDDTQNEAASGEDGASAGGPNRWMAIAEGEIGVSEVAGKGGHNKRILRYHQTTGHFSDDETPWCSSFVNWVLKQAGHVGTNSAAARSWIGWGMACEPRYGAVTVIRQRAAGGDAATGSTSGYHVGFLTSAHAKKVRLLGGNQSDKVKFSNFPHAGYDVVAFRWPG